MIDPILKNRLDALEQNLRKIEYSLTQRNEVFKSVQVAPQVWVALEDTIVKSAKNLIVEVKKIRDGEDQENAWTRYRKTLERSQPLFEESLDLLGGLAFREHNESFDSYIWHVADWVIHECSLVTRQEPSLTVPATREAMRKTIARLIRMRFPESSVWTLPFASQEYGHVLLARSEDAAEPAGLLAPVDARLREEFHDAGTQVTGLIADAFATYVMGPAYAAGTICLRLDPTLAYATQGEHPADDTRARVILETLKVVESMSGAEFGPIHQRLEENWQGLLAQAHPTGAPPLLSERAAEFTRVVVGELDTRLAGPAMCGPKAWNVARELQVMWTTRLNRQSEPVQDGEMDRNLTDKAKLRDVINAAWQCRVLGKCNIDLVARAAIDTCKRVIPTQPEPARGPPSPPGGSGKT
jgi:hypothetical protein